MYRTATFTVKAVIMSQMDQFALATALTTFRELMEIHDSVRAESRCPKELHEQKVAK